MQINEVNLTSEQIDILKTIHSFARQMEKLNNSGKAHGLIALLEELSNCHYIDNDYLREKLMRLTDKNWDWK